MFLIIYSIYRKSECFLLAHFISCKVHFTTIYAAYGIAASGIDIPALSDD